MRTRSGIFALGLACASTGPALAQDATVDSLALARQYTIWLYAGEADSLLAHSTERAREGFSTVESWNRYAEQISSMAGLELGVVEETWKLRNGDCQYYRLAAFSGMEDYLLIRWIIDEDGRIAGVGLGPASQAPEFEADHCETPPTSRGLP